MTMATLPLAQLAAAIAAGEISAREALEACIARIEATDRDVNAFTGASAR